MSFFADGGHLLPRLYVLSDGRLSMAQAAGAGSTGRSVTGPSNTRRQRLLRLWYAHVSQISDFSLQTQPLLLGQPWPQGDSQMCEQELAGSVPAALLPAALLLHVPKEA